MRDEASAHCADRNPETLGLRTSDLDLRIYRFRSALQAPPEIVRQPRASPNH